MLIPKVTITSCSNDDDDSSASIEAQWQISQEGETLETLESVENEGPCELYVYKFSKGGIFKDIDFDYDEDTKKCVEDTDAGTWTKKDKTLTVKHDGEDDTVYEIINVTDSTLILKETDIEGIWYTVYNRKK